MDGQIQVSIPGNPPCYMELLRALPYVYQTRVVTRQLRTLVSLQKTIRETLGGERVDPTSPKIVDKLGFDGTRWANCDTKKANEKNMIALFLTRRGIACNGRYLKMSSRKSRQIKIMRELSLWNSSQKYTFVVHRNSRTHGDYTRQSSQRPRPSRFCS